MTGAGLLAGCWLAGVAVSRLGGVPGIPLDSAARSAARAVAGRGPIEAVSQVLAVVGEQPVSIVVAVALGVAIVVRWGLAPGLAFGLASAASAGQVIAMKAVVQRPGPVIAFFEGLGSFPSGHTANAAVIATFGGFLVRRRWARVAGALYVALVAASRVVLGAHWFTDTVVGAAEGAGVALLVLGIWSAIRRRRREASVPEAPVRVRVRRPEPPPNRMGALWAVLTAVLITVVFVAAILTLKGGFTAIVVIAYRSGCGGCCAASGPGARAEQKIS